MVITARQISIIQNSFKKVKPIAEQAAELFYGKLFTYNPSLKKVFKSDMQDQGRKLMKIPVDVVASLNDLNALVPILQKMAKQHLNYGVKVGDYTPVGNALLYALKQGLGPAFTSELRQAWIDVYQIVANTMREAAYPSFNPDTYKNTSYYRRTR